MDFHPRVPYRNPHDRSRPVKVDWVPVFTELLVLAVSEESSPSEERLTSIVSVEVDFILTRSIRIT